ncbi:MAG TPA: hypothetical protein DIT65_03895 [Cryomorphaceae bacterium]|nr:hypothetical protein [Cryomorphaceae bacterium]|tara:strand:- start:7428 stop:7775 length:348 start_codon:yes stop_codon:yes gene_type:complete
MAMKKHLVLILYGLILAGASSCENSSSSDIFYYDETGCADVWWVNFNDTLAPGVYESVVSAYLLNADIEMYSFDTFYDSTVAELCFACHCRTGTVLQVEVESGNKRKMRSLGFYQ